jgi:hypothetical protein
MADFFVLFPLLSLFILPTHNLSQFLTAISSLTPHLPNDAITLAWRRARRRLIDIITATLIGVAGALELDGATLLAVGLVVCLSEM